MTIYDELHRLFEYRDGELWRKIRTSARCDVNKPAGGVNGEGYVHIRVNNKKYKAHRLIYQMHNPEWDITDTSRDNQIDHINRIKSDNDIENLRIGNHSQNQANSGKYKNNTSGYTGVSWHKQSRKWSAYVGIDGKMVHLGLYECKDEAYQAYCMASKEYHGDFTKICQDIK